jgi:hypothetical protein
MARVVIGASYESDEQLPWTLLNAMLRCMHTAQPGHNAIRFLCRFAIGARSNDGPIAAGAASLRKFVATSKQVGTYELGALPRSN